MDDDYLRKVMTATILAILAVLTFFLLKPILLSIVMGLVLAFIFSPVYNLCYKITKMKNLSSALVCLLLIFLIIIPIWFLLPTVINQSIKIYMASQQLDFVTPLKSVFPSLFDSEQFSSEVGSILFSFTTKITNSLMNILSNFILNFPTFLLQLVVVFVTLFFVLRDKKELIGYIKSVLPFSKEVENKLFESSKDITASVLYGQIIIGMVQGLIAGIGFFVAGVPNALLFTALVTLAGVLPVIGTILVWVPIMIYLFMQGQTGGAVIVIIFGLISSNIDNFLRPIIVSRKSKMHSGLILISMMGGFFLFGVLGFILGPLVLAYLIITLEIYRSKKKPIFLQKNHQKNSR